MSAESPKGMNTGKILTIAAFIAMAGALSFFMYGYFTKKSALEATELTVDNLTSEIDVLDEELEQMKTELDAKDMNIEEKERLIAEKEAEILEKTAKINRLISQNKISKEEAERLRAKVEQLDYYITKYQKEVDELKAQNAMLATRVDSLSGTIDTMRQEIHEADMKIIEIENVRDAAAIHKVTDFHFYVVKASGREIEDTEFRKGRMDDFRICMNVVDNPAAPKKNTDFYVQILDPEGKVITDSGTQSGYFDYQGKNVAYSAKKTIPFNGEETNFCIDFKQPANMDYTEGVHSIKVFANGTEIRLKTFTVK